ncbi:MAG: redoxin domain-containing protein, partial [Bacteroidales bacterium]|nr:redoxin domain-containing protein [Bacteroidales bacterium]
MKRFLLSIGLSIIIITAINAQDGESTLTRVGQEAPAFSCTTVEGDLVDTKAMKGKVIWINFFATWCPPCKKELPALEKNVMDRYGDNPDFVLVVLGRE